jgi:hypothetical protein
MRGTLEEEVVTEQAQPCPEQEQTVLGRVTVIIVARKDTGQGNARTSKPSSRSNSTWF